MGSLPIEGVGNLVLGEVRADGGAVHAVVHEEVGGEGADLGGVDGFEAGDEVVDGLDLALRQNLLAVALAECAIAGGVGLTVDADIKGRLDAALFGESGARAIVSTQPSADLTRIGVKIGTVGGDRFQLGPIDVPLAEASEAWQSALPNLLDG